MRQAHLNDLTDFALEFLSCQLRSTITERIFLFEALYQNYRLLVMPLLVSHASGEYHSAALIRSKG
jgi:hypothetical protein